MVKIVWNKADLRLSSGFVFTRNVPETEALAQQIRSFAEEQSADRAHFQGPPNRPNKKTGPQQRAGLIGHAFGKKAADCAGFGILSTCPTLLRWKRKIKESPQAASALDRNYEVP